MDGTKRSLPEDAGQISPAWAIARLRDLFLCLLCLAPPLYLSNRLSTLHTVTDNKWLVVVFLSACTIALSFLVWGIRPDAGADDERRRLPCAMLLVGGAVALIVAHLIAALSSKEAGFSLRAAIQPLMLIALFATIVWVPPETRTVRKQVALAVAVGAVIGACALVQYAGYDPIASLVRYRDPDQLRTGVYVTLGNPEYLGGYLAPVSLVALGLCLGARGDWRLRVAALGAFFLTLIPAVISGSRGAFIGMVLGGVVLLVGFPLVASRLSGRIRVAAGSVGLAAVMVVVAAAFWGPPSGPFGLLRARIKEVANPYSASIRSRIVFNVMALRLIAANPVIGVGPGMYGVEFYGAFLDAGQSNQGLAGEVLVRDLEGRVAEHAHNDWLELWAETGTLGFAAWLWLLVAWSVAVVRGLRRAARDGVDGVLLLAVLAAVASLLVNAFFNFPLHEPVRATLFWLLAAWGAVLSLDPQRRVIGGKGSAENACQRRAANA